MIKSYEDCIRNKNYWNALLTASYEDNSSITGMNCRHVVNVLDTIFKKVKEKGY